MNRLNYMEFPIKESPSNYLDDPKVDIYNETTNGGLYNLLEKYTDAYYFRTEEYYQEFKNELQDFNNKLSNLEHEQEESIKDYLFADSVQGIEFEDKLYLESTKNEVYDDIKDKLNDMVPVYVIFNNSSAFFSKVIEKVTGGNFSHTSFSVSGMTEIFSFGNNDKNDGLLVENITELIGRRRPKYIRVDIILIPKKLYRKIYEILLKFKYNYKKYSYALKDVFLYPFLKNKTSDDISLKNPFFFCSNFVSWLLSNISLSLDNINISPSELSRQLTSHTKKTYTVFDGLVKDFDERVIERIEDKVKNTKEKINKRLRNKVKKSEKGKFYEDAFKNTFVNESPNNIIETDTSKLVRVINKSDTDMGIRCQYNNILNNQIFS